MLDWSGCTPEVPQAFVGPQHWPPGAPRNLFDLICSDTKWQLLEAYLYAFMDQVELVNEVPTFDTDYNLDRHPLVVAARTAFDQAYNGNNYLPFKQHSLQEIRQVLTNITNAFSTGNRDVDARTMMTSLFQFCTDILESLGAKTRYWRLAVVGARRVYDTRVLAFRTEVANGNHMVKYAYHTSTMRANDLTTCWDRAFGTGMFYSSQTTTQNVPANTKPRPDHQNANRLRLLKKRMLQDYDAACSNEIG